MILDVTPLTRAAKRLEEGLARYFTDTNDAQIRDGLIQRFEFTYDLSTKMLRRALEARADVPQHIDQMSFASMIRTANEQGLLSGNWPDWRGYRDMRNITSHTYDEAKAQEVVLAIPAFLEEVCEMLRRLDRRPTT